MLQHDDHPSPITATIKAPLKIIATIKVPPKVVATIKDVPKVTACLKGVTVGTGVADIYEGKHIVEPKPFEEVVLDTKGKFLKEDVHVLEIPFYEVGNEFGNTIYIGNEVKVDG